MPSSRQGGLRARSTTRGRASLADMALEESESLFVELADVLIDRGVRAHFEYGEFAHLDAAPKRLDEAGRSHHIVAAESDVRRRFNLRELADRVMGDDSVGLTEKCVNRLVRTAAHEGCELLDIFGLGRVKLRREAEGKDALDDHLRDAAKRLRDGPPAADDGLQEWVALRPAGVQRERLHAFRMFAREPEPNRAAQRQAAHMRSLDADRGHEGGDVVGEQFGRVDAVWLVGLAGAARIKRNAGEMLGI